MLGVSDYSQTAWLEFLTDLEDSVLVCDTSALELAHWSVTVPILLERYKVVNVHHVADKVVGYESTSIFFLLGEWVMSLQVYSFFSVSGVACIMLHYI